MAQIKRGDAEFTIVNAYTQFNYRGSGRKVDYVAVKECFKKIVAHFPNAKIGYPLIGAGLAGGDWNEISKIIEQELQGLDHSVVIYKPS